jgi:hypothetical protein
LTAIRSVSGTIDKKNEQKEENMMRMGSTLGKPLVWGIILLAVFIILSPSALRANACLEAFLQCVTDLPAYFFNPFHLTYCVNGALFCLAYLPT